ncbi:MAG: tyrosine-type recombinase/integrase [Actinobacteria bacterium]|nr:tyrosine-type recombinase/integrase [Actinomycetota bacterium]
MKLDGSLELYFKYLRYEKNLTPNSIRSYSEDILQLHRFLYSNNINDTDQMDLASFRNFLKSIDGKKYANRTIIRKYSSYINYFRFLEENKLTGIQLSQFIIVPRKRERLYTFLSKNEIEKLFDSMEIVNILQIRDRLIVELIYSTGARVGEVENIRLADIDSGKREIKVTGKGRKQRIVYINRKALYWLERYLKESRPELSFNKKLGTPTGDLHLLLNSNGGGLSSRSINEIVRKYVRLAGIKKKITPHSIRHSFASHLLQGGAGIREIQELLGHENISTTEIYSHLDIKKIKDDYRRFHPRAK